VSDNLELIRRITERSRRGALVVIGLGAGLALLGLLLGLAAGNRPALVGLVGAAAVCVLVGSILSRTARRTGRTLAVVLRDRPESIASIATVAIQHRTNSGITLSRERTVGVRLDDGTRFALRSLTADEETEILAILHQLAPHARRLTGHV
jgi:hypothetical protein